MTCSIAMVVVPDFNLLATVGFLDPFRAANYLGNQTLYSWRIASSKGGPVRASNGMVLDTVAITELKDWRTDMAVISASWTPEAHYADAVLIGAIRRWRRQGVMLCGLDTGAFLLGRAGVLSGKRATAHYVHLDTLPEVYPQIESSEDLFVFDGSVATCSGGVAAVDMALQVIRKQHGDAIANASARYILHDRLRGQGERQLPAQYEPLGQSVPAALRDAIFFMEQHLENTVTVPQIADHIGVSQRHLGRLFRRYVRSSIVQYYRDIRLDRGRALVTQSDMTVVDIAIACGFVSAEHFSRAYRKRFDISPRDDRQAGRIPFEYRAWPMHPKGRGSD